MGNTNCIILEWEDLIDESDIDTKFRQSQRQSQRQQNGGQNGRIGSLAPSIGKLLIFTVVCVQVLYNFLELSC